MFISILIEFQKKNTIIDATNIVFFGVEQPLLCTVLISDLFSRYRNGFKKQKNFNNCIRMRHPTSAQFFHCRNFYWNVVATFSLNTQVLDNMATFKIIASFETFSWNTTVFFTCSRLRDQTKRFTQTRLASFCKE